MEQLFIFTALVQAALISSVLGIKASKKDLPAMLLPFLQMVGYRHRDVIGRKPSFL